MAVSEVESVLEFLHSNGFSEAECALREEMIEKKPKFSSFDFEKFVFPMVPPPPRVRITASLRRSEPEEGGRCSRSSSGDDEFVSLGTSTSGVCSSEFTNPYGLRSESRANSEASSDRLSQFGTARDYPDFDMQNDHCWYAEGDDGSFLTPSFRVSDSVGSPSEDKFVMTFETDKQCENLFGLPDDPEGFESGLTIDYLDKPCLLSRSPMDNIDTVSVTDYFHVDGDLQCANGFYQKRVDGSYLSSKEPFLKQFPMKLVGDVHTYCGISQEENANTISIYSMKNGSINSLVEELDDASDPCNKFAEKDDSSFAFGESREENVELHGLNAADEAADTFDELQMYDNQEDEYEVFDLRIIHRKNRTGFEENKDLPIVLNTIIAGRYYVTEYLGSAAFSKVVQAHDLHTGIDVCLKIIKNDKDFFDQSLDEIKLLKLVNKHDPADQHHILRLYDYFYHQEHLFVVCELLKANLYEFQKFNQESGGEVYFSLSRLQAITRQCLDALEYLHQLGIIHCDLKPENILMKSYRRCEIKVIDLGSSCFHTDNLCLYVQSRSYRAPEVILGLPYDQKIDMWSLGCILAELCSGEVLFPNDGVVMILARIIGMLGPIDLEMLVEGQEANKYFTREFDLYHQNEETDQLEYIIPEKSSLEQRLQVSDMRFINFLRSLLEVNPQRRPTAREALQHPWLSHSYE